MLAVPGGAVVQGYTAMHLSAITSALSSEQGGDGFPASAPADISPDGPSEMLSSPGTLQIAKITRSAVCNSSLAPNEKRVVGGFCFIRDGVQTSRALPDVFSLSWL